MTPNLMTRVGTPRAHRARQVSLAVAGAVASISFVFDLARHEATWAPKTGLLACGVVTLAVNRLRPAWSEWTATAFLVCGAYVVTRVSAVRGGELVAALPLVFLGAGPFFAVLLGSMRTAVFATALSVVGIAWTFHRVAFEGTRIATTLTNLLVTALVGGVCACVQLWVERTMRVRAGAIAAERRRELDLVHELNRLLFFEFRAPLDRVVALLASPNPLDPAVFADEGRKLLDVLDRGRASVVQATGDDDAPVIDASEAGIRAQLFAPVVAVSVVGLLFAAVRNVLLHSSGVLAALAFALVGSLAALLVRHRIGRPPQVIIHSFVALAVGVMVTGALVWGGRFDAPNLVAIPSFVMLSFTIGGLGDALAATGLLTTFLVVLLADNGATRDNVTVAINLVLLQAFTVATCWLHNRNLRADLRDAKRETVAFAEATRDRRRLTATLFHDQGNLLQSLSAVEILGAKAEVYRPELIALTRRMIALLDAIRSIYDGDAPVRTEALREVSVGALFDGLSLLYRARLMAKRQTLVLEGDRGSMLRAVPAIVLDSVLSNLASNAIKFTPTDGTIRLVARTRGDRVELTVQDEGPGLPPQLAELVGRAERLPSTAGTAGEAGHGYGLLLAADFTRRMGGVLRVGGRQGQGEVTVAFPALL